MFTAPATWTVVEQDIRAGGSSQSYGVGTAVPLSLVKDSSTVL